MDFSFCHHLFIVLFSSNTYIFSFYFCSHIFARFRTTQHHTTQHTQPIILSYWLRKKHWVRYFFKFFILQIFLFQQVFYVQRHFFIFFYRCFENVSSCLMTNFYQSLFFCFFYFYFSASFLALSSAERNADESVDRLLIEVCESLLQNDRYVHINNKYTNKLICMIFVTYYLSLEHTNKN